jgi:hypothetical protein
MRTTSQKPAESLTLSDSIRLADDSRRFRVLSIEPPAGSSGSYRIALQSEDGLSTVLNCDADELLTVWIREVACPYRVDSGVPFAVPPSRVRRVELSAA